MSNWKPIETAPKDGTKAMLSDGLWVGEGYWERDPDHEGWYMFNVHWTDNYGIQLENITHWQPLPDPPIGSGNK